MHRTLPAFAAALVASTAAYAEPASQATRAANGAMSLPVEDGEDAEFAARGFIAAWPEPQIKADDGRVVWDFTRFANLPETAPDTVNPSLWRHQRLMAKSGLFKVSERVYQVRGFDAANMTIVVGDTGLIIIDPLTAKETAHAALTLARRTLGEKPVKAVIYSHSHADHFGGARGVVDEADVTSGRVAIIAPEGFVREAVGENVIAGNAMSRRGVFQFGFGLEAGPEGLMGVGIGQAVANGTLTFVPPTKEITRTGETLVLDGVTIEFQLTPNTEAPAEMHFFLPQLKTLVIAENAGTTLHNVLTPRGALVRDSKAWAGALTQSLRLFGARSDYLVTSHGWPRFGNDKVVDVLSSQRDLYAYLHDQSVRLMNQGYTGAEIAERITLPEGLAKRWFNRGYYGTMRHNSRAVYQRYLGWYDANPAHLNALPHAESAARYVSLMGGAGKVLAAAQKAMQAGDYRWAAELLDKLVFADPDNTRAKELLAQAHTQMGYQAESAIWRAMYLQAALELRNGVTERQVTTGSADFIRNTPTDLLLDLLAVRLDPQKAGNQAFTLSFVFPERKERHLVSIRNGVLIHEANVPDRADVSVTVARAAFLQTLFTRTPPAGAQIEGDASLLPRFFALFETPDPNFEIVKP